MTISRILAISLATSLLHHHALALYLPAITGLVIFYISFTASRYKMSYCQVLKMRGWESLMTPLRSMVTNTSKRSILVQTKLKLLRWLQDQTFPNATPPIGKILPFSKIAITVEPTLGLRISKNLV